MTTNQDTMTEITNGCACVTYNEDTGDFEPAPECWGDCWDCAVEEFTEAVEPMLEAAREFRIEGFPTWSGPVSGVFDATTASALLDAITPDRTEWILRYEVTGTTLTGVLSHHDGTGTIAVTPTPVEDDEVEA